MKRRCVLVLPLTLALLVPVSARAGKKDAKKPADGSIPLTLIWPMPPEKPRIRYIGELHGAADVEAKQKRSILNRLAGIEKEEIRPALQKPYGVTTDSKGRIFVSDTLGGAVFVFDREHKTVSYVGEDTQVRLRMPFGVTVDKADWLWVADAAARQVYAFDQHLQPTIALGGKDELVNPLGVAVDNDRNRVYVVDSKAHTVHVYDRGTGERLGQLGRRGTQPGQFNFPTNITLDPQGRIYVVDTGNWRVQVFDPDYKLVGTWGTQGIRFGQFRRPKGIALDSYGNAYVVDSDFSNFQIFNPKRSLLLFVGNFGGRPGQFILPAGIHIGADNMIYVADQLNKRVQVFQLVDGTTEEPPAAGASGERTGESAAKPKQ